MGAISSEMSIFSTVEAFFGELLASRASLFKRGETDVKCGIGMILAKTALFV